jgi:hypothetical protein
MKNKFKYVILSSSYKETSGGVAVLHKLCDLLNKLGETALMLPAYRGRRFRTNPSYNTPVLDAKGFNPEDPSYIIIYPEGSPFLGGSYEAAIETHNVVRWALYYPTPPRPGPRKGPDLKILYSELFRSDSFFAEQEILSVFETQKDFFKDLGQKREGNCFLVKKGGPNRQRILNSPDAGKYEKPGDSEIFPKRLSYGRMLKIFNKHKRFYSYDCETYISTIAALCGCESVIVPDPTKSKQDILAQEYLKHGVAYGLDDLDRANETRGELISDLEKLEEQNIVNVKKFIKTTHDWFIV